ncbi:hypothetical protein MHU86_5288 [Fragilaria crotonensis]|nr:hypothetical protein MHU86_5288 [Fragilaria crotonensis]
MRLFTKSPPSPQFRGTSPSSNKQPAVSPRNQKWQSRRSTKQSNSDADPYALTHNLTAHGYESDDSDAELERMPSRYDLNASLPDDIAFDDCSNDRYSQVGRPLGLMNSDSDSVQWRSLDEYDERDPNSAVYDPLVFDNDNEDWDDGNNWRQPLNSSEDYRNDARLMRSLTDDPTDSQDDDESPQTSISSDLDSEEYGSNSIVDSRQESIEERVPLFPSDDDVTDAGVLGDRMSVTAERRKGSNSKADVIMLKGYNSKPDIIMLKGYNSKPEVVRLADGKVSKKAKRSVSQQDNIVERVAHELNASKEREQNRKDAKKVTNTKRFGLFRRKNRRDPDYRAQSRQMDQQQLGQALENDSEAQANDDNDDMEGPLNAAPRGILRASSFVSRPDGDANQNDRQHACEAAAGVGLLSLFSSFFVGNNADAPVTGEGKHIGAESSKHVRIALQEEGFLGAMCGNPQAIVNESSEVQVSPDPVMDIRSPISNNDVEDAVLMQSPTMQAEQGIGKNMHGTLTTIDNDGKVHSSRSMAVENETPVTKEEVGNEQVLVQCLRDSHCNGAADCVSASITRLDNLGCQHTFEFMDDFITAKDPRLGIPDGTLGIEARALSLEGNESGQWKGRMKQQLQPDAILEDGHDLPIKMIEFPVAALDLESASGASMSSFGGRRKNDLYVDTQLEQEIRQMQEELSGSKKKSLFGRMKRSNKN